MRVLVVDDDADIRFILGANLRRWGHDVLEAANAAEAHTACVEESPDIMLLDVSMPGESGLELLARLDTQAITPPGVAVLSAAILPGHHSPIADRDIRHLSKPFGLGELEELLVDLVADVERAQGA